MSPSLLDVTFLGLLGLVAVARRFVPDRRLGLFGAIVSAVLIGVASPQTLVAIGGIAVGYLYPLARVIQRIRTDPARKPRARLVMRMGIVALVALLVFFKVYTYFRLPFFGDDGVGHQLLHLVGFSYFLFRAIDYLYMQVLSDAGPGRIDDLLFYVLFPSTLTSGPIQKYLDFRRELAAPRPASATNAGEAIYRITKGYFYKLVVGWVLLGAVHGLLAQDRIQVWDSVATMAVLYLYFFFDFAGYSHVAIGFGLLMGVKVPENFRRPFTATSVTEFWRNWHITLVDWLRDHVFIPLGGLRATRWKASCLAFVLMVIVGLWHGLTWACVVWGAWHGLILFSEGMTGTTPMPPAKRHGPAFWRRVGWTNLRVALGELLFLALPGIGTWDDFWRVAHGFARWS